MQTDEAKPFLSLQLRLRNYLMKCRAIDLTMMTVKLKIRDWREPNEERLYGHRLIFNMANKHQTGTACNYQENQLRLPLGSPPSETPRTGGEDPLGRDQG